MIKYADAEAVEVLSPEEQQNIGSELHKLGKTNARLLSQKQRERVLLRERCLDKQFGKN